MSAVYRNATPPQIPWLSEGFFDFWSTRVNRLWTLRRPFRRLSYHGAYRMFTRANATLGANWSLHDLRHTAAYRMARDPQLPLTDVQWVLGHASLTTTQIYLNPLTEDVLTSVFAHQARLTGRDDGPPPEQAPAPEIRYRSESLSVLFGTDQR